MAYPAGLPSVREALAWDARGLDERKCAPVPASEGAAKSMDAFGKLRRARYRRGARGVIVRVISVVEGDLRVCGRTCADLVGAARIACLGGEKDGAAENVGSKPQNRL
ncbi:hypothetical protein PSPO01_04744 [Paraphaeosphaeria sporulosa]